MASSSWLLTKKMVLSKIVVLVVHYMYDRTQSWHSTFCLFIFEQRHTLLASLTTINAGQQTPEVYEVDK